MLKDGALPRAKPSDCVFDRSAGWPYNGEQGSSQNAAQLLSPSSQSVKCVFTGRVLGGGAVLRRATGSVFWNKYIGATYSSDYLCLVS